MALQTTINIEQAYGKEGSYADNSPRRAMTKVLAGNTPTLGRVFTQSTTNEKEAIMGGTGAIVGIAINDGTAALGCNLTASLEVRVGATATIANFAHVLVKPSNAVDFGDAACYTNADGIVKGGTAGTGETQLPNSRFISKASVGQLAILELNL